MGCWRAGECQSTVDNIAESFEGMQRVEKLQVQNLVLTWHVKPTPYNALSFANMTIFARTDTTSSMMRFAERGHTETCFSIDYTSMNRPIYILGTFLLAIYTSSDILHAFYQPFSLPTYNFHQYIWETNFLWNSVTCYF